MTLTRVGFLAAALAGCGSGPSPDTPAPAPQRVPHLDGVLADGRISPEWGLASPEAPALADTAAWPRLSLPDALAWHAASGGDTLRVNVAARVAGFRLCPPCPADAACEPCPSDAVVLGATLPNGRALLEADVTVPYDPADLRAFRPAVASVEITRGTSPTCRLAGLALQ